MTVETMDQNDDARVADRRSLEYLGDRKADPNDEARAADRRSLDALGHQIIELAGHLNAANYRFLRLIAEFDRRKGWGRDGTASCAHWLNWRCGIDMGAAREKVRTAHALASLPKIAAAMARGDLSYAKVGLQRIPAADVSAETPNYRCRIHPCSARAG